MAEQDQEDAISDGDMCEDDKVEIEYHDDISSVLKEEPEKGLRSFRRNPCWDDDREDGECSSTDDEEAE